MHIQLPYGKIFLPVEIPDQNILDVVLPKEIIQPERMESLIHGALRDPLGSDRLEDIAKPGDQVAIVVDDYTRPCPTQQMLPPVLDLLRTADVDDTDVLIIVGCGSHTPPTSEQIKDIVGERIARTYQVLSNDAYQGDHVAVGTTKRGNTVEVLRTYIDADIKILLGDIGYHPFAGYSGTRKSILPGIASFKTIQRNHKLMFEANAHAGVLKDNPIHHEMNEAMHFAGCDFAFNVVLNSFHRIVGAWTGKPEAVLDVGAKLVDSMYKKEVTEPADIAIVSAGGYPHDIDLYHAHKALQMTLPLMKKQGVIVFIAECIQGVGNQIFDEWMHTHHTATEIKSALQKEFVLGAHRAYYHYDAVEHHPIFLVSSLDKKEVETIYHVTPAQTPQEALENTISLKGKDARIRVIPQGCTTLITKKQ
ncbi:MAG: nickel-dependent lactate racemase [Methanobacteriota archaeon]